MTIRHQFEYQTTDGKKAITLLEWIDTLPADQQQEFFAARTRQLAYRKQCIQQGLLVIDVSNLPFEYVWRDEAAAKNGKPADSVWLAYFERYLQENNITFKVIESHNPT